MSKYEISVIIPLHNTDLTMFSNCVESLKNQEIGFENIELIVVMHNCDEGNADGVRKILKGYDNIILEELHNEVHSPSSPRNRGIAKASGDYITFLDSDDMFTPECLYLALKYVKKADADICHFRKKLLLEKEGSVIFNELELWDQTQEMIVVDHNTWDERKLFAGVWGMSTGRLYRRKLLIENNLRFDENIKFAEDYHFVIGVYAAADKICLAPQLIGYIYYVNGGSLVQTTSITEDLIMDYVSGFKKVFDKGLSSGIWMNDAMAALMLIIINWIFGCKDLSEEGRLKIAELMEPYIRMLEVIPPTKLYAGGRNDRINTLLTKYILREAPKKVTFIKRPDEGSGQNLLDRQKDALARIIRNGIHSDYSEHYGFKELDTIEEYQSRVPVSNYDTYYPMIRLTTDMGERGIFTDNEIIAYAFIGDTKDRIPVTYKAIVPYVNALRRSLGCAKTFILSEALPFKESRLTMDYKYSNSIFGVALKQYVKEAENFESGYAVFTTPKEQLFPKEYCDLTVMHWVEALQYRDVETVFSPDRKTLSLRLKELKDNWDKIYMELKKMDCERAKELQEILLSNDEISMKTLWTGLKKEVCLDEEYLLDEYALYGETDENGNVSLDMDYVFYEFYKDDEASYYTVADISEGEEYKVIISNLCGLYRYETALRVRCIKKEDNRLLVNILR